MAIMTLNPMDYIEAETVAELAGVSRDTLSKWRSRKEGPNYIRISGKQVRYLRTDVLAWLEARYKGNQNGNREEGRPVVLPVHSTESGVPPRHRFGRNRTKQETGRGHRG